MRNEQQDKAMFISFCIEQYAKAKNTTTEEVANLFEHYGISEHFWGHLHSSVDKET